MNPVTIEDIADKVHAVLRDYVQKGFISLASIDATRAVIKCLNQALPNGIEFLESKDGTLQMGFAGQTVEMNTAPEMETSLIYATLPKDLGPPKRADSIFPEITVEESEEIAVEDVVLLELEKDIEEF